MPTTPPPTHEDRLSVREFPANETEWMLRAALMAIDHGLLLTGLDGVIIAANLQFGEIFGVSPDELRGATLDEWRSKLHHVVANPVIWLTSSQAIYSEPERHYEDVLELRRDRRIVVRRHSAPIRVADESIIGRLWTYRDITHECRLAERDIHIQEISQIYDPNPEVVLRKLLEVASRYFDNSNAVLSLCRAKELDFKIVVGPHKQLGRAKGNKLEDSYCQFALSTQRPIIIQNAEDRLEYCDLMPARFGFTRYLGVPIFDSELGAVGTICILDGKSNQLLDDLDVQFMTLLSMRVAAELARERHLLERLASKEAQINSQRADLVTTNSIFEAMNDAFSLLASSSDSEKLLSEQTRLLVGLLGYSSAAVLIKRDHDSKLRGFVSRKGVRRQAAIVLDATKAPSIPTETIGRLDHSGDELSEKMASDYVVYARRHEADVGEILVALGRSTEPPMDERHRVHLEAIADHVCLLLATYLLHARLGQANFEIEGAQARILQKEKLSVVGTLAASTAHDIRNITASLGLLASPGLVPPEQTLEAIREQLGRFDVLAHRLMSYAKPRMVAKERVSIQDVLEAVIGLTAAQARIANVSVLHKPAVNLPTVTGDSHQFEHLFVNLILNGVQSMERNGGTLKIKADRIGKSLRIQISDCGPGLAKDVKDKLFEPFSSSKSDGFGLGLYSCKRIVEAHGGTIAAKGKAGSGSTFIVDLPISSESHS